MKKNSFKVNENSAKFKLKFYVNVPSPPMRPCIGNILICDWHRKLGLHQYRKFGPRTRFGVTVL